MCEFGGLVLGALSVGLDIWGNQQRYKSDMDAYQRHMDEIRQNAINASQAAEAQYSNLGTKVMQEGLANAQQQFESKLAAAKAISGGEVAASSGGVRGNSVAHVLGDVYRQSGRNEVTLERNQQMMRDYLQGEMQAIQYGGQSQINALPMPERPSPLPYILNIFGSGLDQYNKHLERKLKYS